VFFVLLVVLSYALVVRHKDALLIEQIVAKLSEVKNADTASPEYGEQFSRYWKEQKLQCSRIVACQISDEDGSVVIVMFEVADGRRFSLLCNKVGDSLRFLQIVPLQSRPPS
jgi:hypothetical protein